MATDSLRLTLANLSAAFPGEQVSVATPEHAPELTSDDSAAPHRFVAYATPRAQLGWVLAANDYLAATGLARESGARAVLLLGPDAASVPSDTLRALAQAAASGTDLVLPLYTLKPNDALVNSALFYPMSRALFGVDVRFPLPLDAAFSPRMAARVAAAAGRQNALGGGEALLWPVAEAASAGFTVNQVDSSERSLPQPSDADFSTLFGFVVSSLFNDVEGRATFWQRARSIAANQVASPPATRHASGEASAEVAAMAENFRLAYGNLYEVWSLVLPPQSLFQLKRLSLATGNTFVMPPSLWARIVYDFALAYHLRTINRGHLLGAMTPLYLAWVASFLRLSGEDTTVAADLVEDTATAFALEKPYLVSRWRWPDRFNP